MQALVCAHPVRFFAGAGAACEEEGARVGRRRLHLAPCVAAKFWAACTIDLQGGDRQCATRLPKCYYFFGRLAETSGGLRHEAGELVEIIQNPKKTLSKQTLCGYLRQK